jgi:hypothetical protein
MQDFTRTARHIVNADTDYFSCLDEWRRGDDQMLLLHCYFLKVTPRVFRRVLDEWRVLRRVTDVPIYCAGTRTMASSSASLSASVFSISLTFPARMAVRGVFS